MPSIAVLNRSSVMQDAEVARITKALQVQVTRDFFPVWGEDANVVFIPKGQKIPKGWWWLVVLDTSDESGALGYHDVGPLGLPMSKVFAKTDLANGGRPSTTMSHELCFTGDTRIALLDGSTPTIAELVGRESFWVYACKPNGELRPGRGHSARKTREDVEVVRVTLDDGSSFRCTPDHRIMRRDGTFEEARLLQPGDSLMPLYREKRPLDGNRKDAPSTKDYEHVLVPATDQWVPTHRMVRPYCPSGYVRHHANFNRFDNSPENLELMTWEDHKKLHAAHIAEHGRQYRERMKREGRPLPCTEYIRGVVNPNCILCVPINHKVVDVRSDGRADVYDITVDKYHTFALAAGVFVHNCELIWDEYCTAGFYVEAEDAWYAAELADPVQANAYDYQIDGVWVSDFVYPAWFLPDAKGPYDHQKVVKKPLQLMPGGYISRYQRGGWAEVYAKGAPPAARAFPKVGSRRERRRRGRSLWLPSTCKENLR